MRFHMGVSFRLKSLKKFIFPILFGIFAYFLSSYINLGQVYAQSNYDTSYDLTLNEIDFSQYNVFTDINTQEMFDEIIENFNYSTHDLLIQYLYRNSSYSVYVYLIPHQTNLQFNIYGYQNELRIGSETNISNMIFWYFNPNQSFSSASSTNYTRLIECLQNVSTCSPTNTVQGTTGNNTVNTFYEITIGTNGSNFNNSSSYTLNYNNYGYTYYSSNSYVYSSTQYANNATRYVKALTLNSEGLTNQDDLPTYYDLYVRQPDPEPEPEPEPEPDPEPDDINVAFSKYVYWFGEHTNTSEILENIYCLIFLYCIGMISLKFLTIIKNTRW